MHPVSHRLVSLGSGALGNLALVVREDQVHSAAVDIKCLS